MTPLHLEFCLAYYCLANPRQALGNSYDSPSGRLVKQWMADEGLVEITPEQSERPTERLRVFIEHLCAQPLPIQKWIIPQERPE